jgi:hypothetical protein
VDTDVQHDQLLALEAWEAAITAYALEARTLIGTALACVNSGVPFARPSTEALAELLDRRALEERALRACIGTLSLPDGTRGGPVPRQAAAAGPVTHQDRDASG